MTYLEAVGHLNAGRRIRRACWGVGAFIFLVPEDQWAVSSSLLPGSVTYSPLVLFKDSTDRIFNFDARGIATTGEDWEVADVVVRPATQFIHIAGLDEAKFYVR